ncbi:MAG: hypothetical protein J7K47_03600 [Thermoplasmata archaeon]|nr:hypothetical protein [Thermoplasmata archaeon]
MNPIVEKQVRKLNECLTKHILEKIKSKNKILLTLSGGHDTRVVLSILLKHNVPFEAVTRDKFSKGDVPIAKRICEDLKIKHFIFYCETQDECRAKQKKLAEDYDIVLTGIGFSEWMCALHKLYMTYNQLKEHATKYIERALKEDNYSPMAEWECINIIKNIPIAYLAGGYIQKQIIKMNYPKLLKYPFTYFDWRHWLMNKFYPLFVDFIFNSYFRGKGRNYFETKREKIKKLKLETGEKR